MALTAAQLACVEALLNPEHRTIEAAGAAVGIPRRTAYRWLERPDIRNELDGAQGHALDAVARATVTDLADCAALYREILKEAGKPDAVRLRAAQLLADLALRLWEARNIDRRLSDMEAMLIER